MTLTSYKYKTFWHKSLPDDLVQSYTI